MNGVKNGRVVLPSKTSPYLRQGRLGHLFHQVHGDLPWIGDRLGVALFFELYLLELEVFGNYFLNGVDGDSPLR